MKSQKKPSLAIFETFKTKREELTGEANRQRAIIKVISSDSSPSERTRTSISQKIGAENNIIWKNIYSGIFRDLDEILIPLGLVEEAGKLPLKRGPKALQERGIPFYRLTREGFIVAVSIKEIPNRKKLLLDVLSQSELQNGDVKKTLKNLSDVAPSFVYSLFEKYVRAFCEGKIKELIPFTLAKLSSISDESIIVQREFLEGFLKLTKNEQKQVEDFLKKIS